MVSSLISSNSYYDSSYNALLNSTQNTAVVSDSNVADTVTDGAYSTGTKNKETEDVFFNNCIHNEKRSADTLEGYKALRKQETDTTGMSESDYENEFRDYIRFRGCQSSEELRQLDSAKNTYYATKDDLIKFAKNSLTNLESDMKDCDCPLLTSMKDWETVFDSADVSDLVNFAQKFVPKSKNPEDVASFGEKVTGLVTFLNKSLKNDKLSSQIKAYLMKYLQKIGSKWEDITQYSVYLTKKEKEEAAKRAKEQQKLKENSIKNDVLKSTAIENATSATQDSSSSDINNSDSEESEDETNQKKYKEKLISQYQS